MVVLLLARVITWLKVMLQSLVKLTRPPPVRALRSDCSEQPVTTPSAWAQALHNSTQRKAPQHIRYCRQRTFFKGILLCTETGRFTKVVRELIGRGVTPNS